MCGVLENKHQYTTTVYLHLRLNKVIYYVRTFHKKLINCFLNHYYFKKRLKTLYVIIIFDNIMNNYLRLPLTSALPPPPSAATSMRWRCLSRRRVRAWRRSRSAACRCNNWALGRWTTANWTKSRWIHATQPQRHKLLPIHCSHVRTGLSLWLPVRLMTSVL